MARPLPATIRRSGQVAVALVFALTLCVGLAATDAAAQTDDTTVQTTTVDTTVQTTSTLPTDNRELGNSLPKPGRGMEPQDSGDPGGILQTSLFFLICGAIVVIGLLVWRSSHKARARRTAAGLDPVTVARSRGEGVRQGSSDAT